MEQNALGTLRDKHRMMTFDVNKMTVMFFCIEPRLLQIATRSELYMPRYARYEMHD